MNHYLRLGAFAAIGFAIWVGLQSKNAQQIWHASWSEGPIKDDVTPLEHSEECYDSLGIYINQQDSFILAKGEGQYTANIIAQGRLGHGGSVITDTSLEGNTETFGFWTHAQKGDRKRLRTAFESLFALAEWNRTCVASLVLLPSVPLKEKQKDTLQEAARLTHKLILTDLGATVRAFDINFDSGDLSSLAVISKHGAVIFKRIRDPERCSGWRMQPQEYPPPVDVNSLLAFDPANIFDQVIAVDTDILVTPTTPFLRRASIDAIARGAAIEAGRDFWRSEMEWNFYTHIHPRFAVALSPSSEHTIPKRYFKQGQLMLMTSQDNQEQALLYILRDDQPISKLELDGLLPRAAGATQLVVSLKASWKEYDGFDVLAQLVDMESGRRVSRVIKVGPNQEAEFETIPQEHVKREELILAPVQSESKRICGGYCDESQLVMLRGSLISDAYGIDESEGEERIQAQREWDETVQKITELEKKIKAKNGAFERAL